GGNVVIARNLTGELQCGKRLEQREQRPPEQTRLLSCDDRDRAPIGEQRAGLTCARRRLTALLLCGDDVRDVLAAAIVTLRARDGIGPGCAIGRIAGEEWGDRREVVGVIDREPTDPGEAPDVDGRADEGFV